jgi:hypothetical protein
MLPAEERRLLGLFARLGEADRRSLLDFAEFLAGRADAGKAPEGGEPPREPLEIPRPAKESVVAAMKRLRQTYPMVDPDHLLDEASGLMSAHLLGGRPAKEVIDELEVLFERHFRRLVEE